MSEATKTAAWGPTARKISPHPFIASVANRRWCVICDYSEDAYQHASSEQRAEFDQQQAERERWRTGVGRRTAEIEERDFIVHALAEVPGFVLEQLTTAPAPVSFRYYRQDRYVDVEIRVEAS